MLLADHVLILWLAYSNTACKNYVACVVTDECRLSRNLDALGRYDYLQLGRLVALTLLQGGPGLPLFEPPVAQYILTGKITNLQKNNFPVDQQQLIDRVTMHTNMKVIALWRITVSL